MFKKKTYSKHENIGSVRLRLPETLEGACVDKLKS